MFEKFEVGNAILYCGDSLEILDTLEEGSIDACVSDPPYASETFGGCTACKWDIPVNLTEFWRLMENKTKPQANVVLFCNMKLAYDLIDTNKKGFRYDLVWAKNNRVGFFNANLMPLRAHENILVFGRPGHQKTAVYNALKLPGTGKPRVNRVKAQKSGGVYSSQKAYTTVSDGTRKPHSVLAFDRDGNQTEHPTQKPLLLMYYLLKLYSNHGDVILDPFMGSCTTGEAAVILGRRFIGIEKEKQYFEIACQRLEEAYKRKYARYKPRREDPNYQDYQNYVKQTAPKLAVANELVTEATVSLKKP